MNILLKAVAGTYSEDIFVDLPPLSEVPLDGTTFSETLQDSAEMQWISEG